MASFSARVRPVSFALISYGWSLPYSTSSEDDKSSAISSPYEDPSEAVSNLAFEVVGRYKEKFFAAAP